MNDVAMMFGLEKIADYISDLQRIQTDEKVRRDFESVVNSGKKHLPAGLALGMLGAAGSAKVINRHLGTGKIPTALSLIVGGGSVYGGARLGKKSKEKSYERAVAKLPESSQFKKMYYRNFSG